MVVLCLDVFSVSMEVFLRPACSFHLVSCVSGKPAHAVTYGNTSQLLQRTPNLTGSITHHRTPRSISAIYIPGPRGPPLRASRRHGTVGRYCGSQPPARRKPFRLYYSLTWCVVFVIGRYILTAPQRCPGGAQAAMTRLKASSRIDVLRHHLLR